MAKRERGRESATDMVRSLSLVLLIVGVVFFFARPPHSDAKRIRIIDPTSDLQAFSAAAPGGAVPRAMPAGWRSTVSAYDPQTGVLRIGWVTPQGEYAEYAAATHPAPAFLGDITGQAPRGGAVDIDGATWQEYRQGKAISLVRSYGTTTVVLGTLRDTASLEELRVLAGRLVP
ncbi:MAG: hypothetical protein JWP11_724 [Frankiales bacterium]|nr:hypothetical protein [Frankiales bacterium]